MIGYAQLEVFSAADQLLMNRAITFVDRMPGKIDGEYVRCHELARAVAVLLSGDREVVYDESRWIVSQRGQLVVVDGHYGHVEHSWLVTPSLKILDPYIPGALPQVQLVEPYLPRNAYRPGAARSDVRMTVLRELLDAARSTS